MILFIAIILLEEPYIVLVAIALSVIKDALANLSFPAWLALTADIVPIAGRGRYFGSRNFAMGMIGIITTLIAGETITRLAQPSGYQWSFFMAFLIGMASTISFSRIRDPQKGMPSIHSPSLTLHLLLRDLKYHPTFLIWCGVSILWNFSINIAGPFFNVYMVKNLSATATMVGVATIISTISSLAVQQKAGAWIDRWGSKRLMKITT
jgi:Na+/melibiose symporter-like transporter